MTDSSSPRRTRLSKGRVRAVAWVAGGATFVTGIGILGASPKPAWSPTETAAAPTNQRRPVVIVRKVPRRVIVTDTAPSAPIRYVPSTSTSSGGSAGGTSSAPAPAPVTTSTGGS